MRRADVIEWFKKSPWIPYPYDISKGKAFYRGETDAFIMGTRLFLLTEISGQKFSFTLDSLRLDSNGNLTNGLGNLYLMLEPV